MPLLRTAIASHATAIVSQTPPLLLPLLRYMEAYRAERVGLFKAYPAKNSNKKKEEENKQIRATSASQETKQRQAVARAKDTKAPCSVKRNKEKKMNKKS